MHKQDVDFAWEQYIKCRCLACLDSYNMIKRIFDREQNSLIGNNMITMTKRFYVGNQNMAKTYDKSGEVPGNMSCLSEAVQKATNLLEKNNDLDVLFIVEVIKIVRRAPKPVIVEDVRNG